MSRSELRERVLRLAAAERAPTRAEVQRATWISIVAAMIVSAALFALAGGVRATGRPSDLLLGTAMLAAGVTAAASWIALRRGGAVERPRDVLATLLVLVPFALVAGKLSLSARFPGMSEVWPDRPGLRCLALSVILGAAPLAAYLWIWRRRHVLRPGLQGAALGTAAGAFAWTLVDMWCPVAHPGHIALGHVLPLVLLTGAGLVWGRTRRP